MTAPPVLVCGTRGRAPGGVLPPRPPPPRGRRPAAAGRCRLPLFPFLYRCAPFNEGGISWGAVLRLPPVRRSSPFIGPTRRLWAPTAVVTRTRSPPLFHRTSRPGGGGGGGVAAAAAVPAGARRRHPLGRIPHPHRAGGHPRARRVDEVPRRRGERPPLTRSSAAQTDGRRSAAGSSTERAATRRPAHATPVLSRLRHLHLGWTRHFLHPAPPCP